MKRVDQLTFTRFIAVVVVLFFHGGGGVYLRTLSIFPLPPLLVSATTSVTYLYVLSGFVMALAHYRPDEKISFESYWKARFVRLYPLYIIAFLLICYYYDLSIASLKMRNTLANIFVVQAWFPEYAQSYNFPAWSITVEFFFYAVFPFFALWASRQSTKKLIWVALGIWAVTQTTHNALWIRFFPDWTNLLVYFPLFHLSSFILGVTGGIWFLRGGREQEIDPRVNLFFLACGILITSIYVVVSSQVAWIPRGDQLMAGFLAPFLTVVTITLALDKSRISAFLKHPALIALGEMSYALYILHIPIRWLYERALWNSSLENYKAIFDYTYMPLMLVIGFFATFYIDKWIRNELKKIMQRVSLPLFFFDFAILSASIYLSFRLRFGFGREYDSYSAAIPLMFWISFMLRTILSAAFNAFNPSILYGSLMQFVRPVLLSVTIGSIAIGTSMYITYSLNWIDNLPRSIFAIDWAIVLALSLFVRYRFRRAGFYSPKPLTA